MFRSIFRPYGLVWTMLNTVTDILGLSLLWLFCSLPVVTVGPATTALYDAAVHGIRYKEAGAYRRFLKTFRAELKTGIPVTLLWGAVLAGLGYVMAVLLVMAQQNSRFTVYAGVYFGISLLPLACACWSVAVLSRFTFSFWNLTKTALRMTLGQLPRSFCMAAATVGLLWFTLHYPIWTFAAPTCLVLVWSVFTEPVFTKLGGGLTVQQDEE